VPFSARPDLAEGDPKPDPEHTTENAAPLMKTAHKERIVPRLIEEELRDSFIDYSMSVIVQRALPDARDGLNPNARRQSRVPDGKLTPEPLPPSETTKKRMEGLR